MDSSEDLLNVGGIDRGIGGSQDIFSSHSCTFIESLIDVRKMWSCFEFVRFGRADHVAGHVKSIADSIEHAMIEIPFQCRGSGKPVRPYNRQSTTTTNNDDDVCFDGDFRFGKSGICSESFYDDGSCGNQSMRVGKSTHVQVIVEKVEDRNNHTNNEQQQVTSTTTTMTTIYDDHSTTSHAQRPMVVCS